MRRGIQAAIAGAVVTAAVSTLGDYLWANLLPHHRPIYGLAHGALLFLTVGCCLGIAAGRVMAGAAGGALIGISATAGFYLLQPFIGYSGLFVMFVGLWVALGLLSGRVLQRRDRIGIVLIRSVFAAIGSGLGFWAISGIWFPFNPHGWDYAVHFAYWTVVYLPGFAALLVAQRADEATVAARPQRTVVSGP
jgi:hypothetical protein